METWRAQWWPRGLTSLKYKINCSVQWGDHCHWHCDKWLYSQACGDRNAVSLMSFLSCLSQFLKLEKRLTSTLKTHWGILCRSLIPVRAERRFCLDEYFYHVQFNSPEYTIEGVVVKCKVCVITMMPYQTMIVIKWRCEGRGGGVRIIGSLSDGSRMNVMSDEWIYGSMSFGHGLKTNLNHLTKIH